jgi:hypothetical protein
VIDVVRHVVTCMLRASGLPGRRKRNGVICLCRGGFDGW